MALSDDWMVPFACLHLHPLWSYSLFCQTGKTHAPKSKRWNRQSSGPFCFWQVISPLRWPETLGPRALNLRAFNRLKWLFLCSHFSSAYLHQWLACSVISCKFHNVMHISQSASPIRMTCNIMHIVLQYVLHTPYSQDALWMLHDSWSMSHSYESP